MSKTANNAHAAINSKKNHSSNGYHDQFKRIFQGMVGVWSAIFGYLNFILG
jgi:hypothetical protein